MADPNGPEIEALRKKRGWKRSELAERVNCSYQHIYGLERGFNLGTEEMLQRIANELNVTLGAVMAKATPPRKAPTRAPSPPNPVPPPRPTKPPTRIDEKPGAAA